MPHDLGKIEIVQLRNVWATEPEFTRWLSEKEHLTALGDELGIDITLLDTEAAVGDFSADILAVDAATDNKVIIENQFGTTDHDHLGKIITYSSGHGAKYIVWIFEDIREEHRQAMDWLNVNTTDDVNFFGVRLELWQIEASKPAPKFEVVCRPNEWAKTVKNSVMAGKNSVGSLRQLEFWTDLRSYGMEHYQDISYQAPRAQAYMNVSIGSADAHVAMVIRTMKKSMSCELYIPDNKQLYDGLFERVDAIETELGMAVDWQRLENAKAARVSISNDFDIENLEVRQQSFDWLLKNATLFKRVFGKHVKEVEENI